MRASILPMFASPTEAQADPEGESLRVVGKGRSKALPPREGPRSAPIELLQSVWSGCFTTNVLEPSVLSVRKLHRGYLLCGDAGRRPVKHWLRLPWNFGEAVDPTFGIFASKTAGSDCPINVLNVGVQAAQLALAFGTTLAERGHGSRLYDFKKIKLSDGAGL